MSILVDQINETATEPDKASSVWLLVKSRGHVTDCKNQIPPHSCFLVLENIFLLFLVLIYNTSIYFN